LFCVFSWLIPPTPSAQQLPPSVTLRYITGEAGQIGGAIENLGAGPATTDLVAFLTGQLVQPIALTRATGSSITPLYDEQEFPNGPKRVTVTYGDVTLPAGVTIIPGFIGSFLPARLGANLTAQQFINSYISDYILEVNGVRFMDSDLLKPENVAILGPLTNATLPTLPPGEFYIYGLNVTMKFAGPGTYKIRNIMRIPKTTPIPELNAAFLAGEFINEITVIIAAAGSPTSDLIAHPDVNLLGALPTLDEARPR
jgi:hypothetical protein